MAAFRGTPEGQSSRAIGANYERVAAAYLQKRDFRILETNYTCRGGEIDLICEHAGTMVFVEVRARADDSHGAPEETISATKRRRIIHAARHYLLARELPDVPCRFDVVAIAGTTITHFPDAFET